MNFLKKLFTPSGKSENALVLYIKPKMCREIVRVRVDLYNQLSLNDDESGYYLRKVISATRCPFQAEIELFFDRDKRLRDQQITHGEFVTEAAYEAYIEHLKSKKDDD